LCSLFYLIPCLAGAAALAEIAGYDLSWIRARLRPRIFETAA